MMTDKFYYQTPTSKLPATRLKTPRRPLPMQYDFDAPQQMEASESDESVHSTNTESTEASCGTGGGGELSLVAEFDEYVRRLKLQRNAEAEDAMLVMVERMQDLLTHLKMTRDECYRLQQVVDERTHALSDVEGKLALARKLVDSERRKYKQLADECAERHAQLHAVKEFLFRDQQHGGALLSHAAGSEELAFLQPDNEQFDPNVSRGGGGGGHRRHSGLGAIPEVNTTGSLLSDFSYSRSEDDLDSSTVYGGRAWKKPRISAAAATDAQQQPSAKKRRSSTHRLVEINNTDSVRATTTVHVPKHGPITATSIIESVPPAQQANNNNGHEQQMQLQPPTDMVLNMWQQKESQPQAPPATGLVAMREHSLQTKTVVLPDTCGPCDKRLRFGKTALKCKDCRVLCHPECKDKLPLPCIPFVNTPTRNLLGLISDFTPTTAPMVPALIVHCVNEIEERGLREVGLYRIPGSEREVKQMKERFLRGRGAPNIKDCDVHVLCGTVKDFLRHLHEPLVTHALWPSFVQCVEGAVEDRDAVAVGLRRLIGQLPQSNRDTLAYMFLHLKTVADATECKMPAENLAKIFGPTIIGYSSSNPAQESVFVETKQQYLVMEALMRLPREYWATFVNLRAMQPTPRALQQTPSTDSLLLPTTRNIFTPNMPRVRKPKQRIFHTPPYKRN